MFKIFEKSCFHLKNSTHQSASPFGLTSLAVQGDRDDLHQLLIVQNVFHFKQSSYRKVYRINQNKIIFTL